MDETLIRVGIRATALTLRVQDVVLHLKGELMSVAIGTRAAIAQPLKSAFLITMKVVTNFTGDAKPPAIASPASRRATNCSFSFITEPSFQGIHSSPKGEKSVTHVSGRICYRCVGSLTCPVAAIAF